MERGIATVVVGIALLLLPAASGAFPHQDPDPGILGGEGDRDEASPGGASPAREVTLDLPELDPLVGPPGAGRDVAPAPRCRPDDGIGPSVQLPRPVDGTLSAPGECRPSGPGTSHGRPAPAISTGVAPDRPHRPDRSVTAASTRSSDVVPSGWTRQAAPPASVPVVAGLVALAAWILYRRLTRDRVLDNDLRRRVRDLIDGTPGVTAATIADELDVHYDTVRHHLRVLDEFDEIRIDRFGQTRRYFPNHGRYTEADRELLAALRVEARRRILETLASAGGLSSGELAETVGVAPSTASHHLSELEQAGLVSRTRDGRSVRCELTRRAAAGLRMFG